ncbi:class I SAM-dependent methyltransferase [Mesorhizobium sp. M4B.F.Ca.ET.190.01.1.1]|uniref:class I SAM-dependent methyltransferase n=1 Tax=unclassified Mesorhizobium TaxID=325217 RepID=UPI000FE9E9BC|nr:MULTISPECIES: class I SAM-dependent methyltransferase [unclassified Mesorhizobium]RWA61372.1 MAG: class I SAM-dependent methyltransferase [Mesorhizobium sp.]RWF65984.1 MAG: class I SAM-dependent methyltransferase [Mesorhizobium sp.]TGR08916.1 class I SAM-dependent methyltransferase [Mesorhizobium sp. M4B.F.Ca.ET.200.01.1.1]TGS18393.1 class I SAM-dependent methyltransferase [Mesorhizobium sp. M4B.F.Ca.ET.190.01.1.1]TGT30206.1 class I SAM-dependent methyltransferase [Mesorhizobium sp. M4B.F.C
MELDAYRRMAATEDEHWWFCGRRAIAEAVIRGLGLPRDADILEIGAGTGGNIRMLEQFGTVTAVEMNELARRIAREKTGREFLAGHLPDGMPVTPASFDLVCLFDVLEHVAEDEASLETIRRMLKPGGKVVLTVPAHQWLWSKHDVGLHHMRRYSRNLLKTRIEQAGYRVEKLSYTNAALFPVAALARLADRLRRSNTASGQAMPPKPINSAMKALFSAESRILPNAGLPFGVSLLAVFGTDAAFDRARLDSRLAA